MNPGSAPAPLRWVLLLAMVLAASEGKELVLGMAGGSAELPCRSPSGKYQQFSWNRDNKRVILHQQNTDVLRGPGILKRFDSKKSQWDRGSFPLVISELEMEDSGTYVCDVAHKPLVEVELQVYRLTSSPESPLLQDETLTLRLETPPNRQAGARCKDPKHRVMRLDQAPTLSVRVDVSHHGAWTCTVSQGQKMVEFQLDIRVLGFSTAEDTVYRVEGEPAPLCFPLLNRREEEQLRGELAWRAEGAAAPRPWASFSVDGRKVTAANVTQEPKLQPAETLPVCVTLPRAAAAHAGALTLTLTLTPARRPLRRTLNLAVMTMGLRGGDLVCSVAGAVSPGLRLSLHRGNQSVRISEQGKAVRVAGPEPGPWKCLLRDGARTLLQAPLEVESQPWSPEQPLFLSVVLGAAGGLVILAGLSVCCCVRFRHRRRQAERMSQIKRLLSEKKICRCPHRLQRTQELL